jgi:putative ubiquitin-RnfH superfamily antitoxin RatB of RatAB toxin-antitoxin module
MESAEGAVIEVEVVVSPVAGEVRQIGISLPAGSSVRDALCRSGLCPQAAAGDASTLRVGVWGQLKPLDHPLRDRDRVEIYRPLLIDPKDARRRRQRATCSRKRSRP